MSELPGVLDGKDVAVVGGGPGGILCAAHLAKLGMSHLPRAYAFSEIFNQKISVSFCVKLAAFRVL